MDNDIYHGNFTEKAATYLVYHYAPEQSVAIGHIYYGEDEALKEMDGHAFYSLMMDAKNGTVTDVETGTTMEDKEGRCAAWLLFDHYKGAILAVMKKFLLGEQRTSGTIALKEDEVKDYLLKVFLMLSGRPDKKEGVPDIYSSFDPEKVNWEVEKGFGSRLARKGDLVGYLSQIAIRIWKVDAATNGGSTTSLDAFTIDDETGKDNSDRNAALATEDFSDKALISNIFDSFISKARREHLLRAVTLDIFEHARPFFSTPKDMNHMIYAKTKNLLNIGAAKEVRAQALEQGKTPTQANKIYLDYLKTLAFETTLASYAKYNRRLTADSLIADEDLPFEPAMKPTADGPKPVQSKEGFRLGYYGFPTRYKKDCDDEGQEQLWDASYKKLLTDISWRMTNEALRYLKDHPEDFNVLKESEKFIVNCFAALRLVENYRRELEKGNYIEGEIAKITESIEKLNLTSFRENLANVSLSYFTEAINEKNAMYASVVDLMREYPNNDAKVLEHSGLTAEEFREALRSIKEEFKSFIG